ncbi:MAG TPA: hypothetical protein VNY27_12110 [Solirubrobacteraceae bacterium]|nr:hypothetical protein [Solirubrobacteraceae bacterium]
MAFSATEQFLNPAGTIQGGLDERDPARALIRIGGGLRAGRQLGHRDRRNRQLDRQDLRAEQLEVDHDRGVERPRRAVSDRL